MDLIQATHYIPPEAETTEQKVLNEIKNNTSSKEQLKKVATEFESIFVAKMFSTMDKTVDREGGILGGETRYMDKFKSYMYNELGRELASNPHSSIGFAKQIYDQMEKFIPEASEVDTQI